MVHINNCKAKTQYTNNIPQLNLGECKGKVTPPPFKSIQPTSISSSTEKFKTSTSNNFEQTEITNSKPESFTNSFVYSQSFSSFTKSPFQSPSSRVKSPTYSKSKPTKSFSSITKTPTFPPSKTIEYDDDDDNDDGKMDKRKIAIIAGISVGGAVVIAAVIAAAILLYKKFHIPKVGEASPEMMDEDSKQFHNVNPIYDAKADSDPFKDEFADTP